MLSTRTVWRRGVTSLLVPFLPSSLQLSSFVHRREKQFCSLASTEQKGSSLLDVEARVSKLLSDLCLQGITKYPKEQVTCLYQLLLDLGIKAETIDAQLLEMPDLLSYPHTSWTSLCEVMLDHGMPSLKIFQSIALSPSLLKMKRSQLHSRLLQYRRMGIGKLDIFSLSMKHPVLLFLEPAKVKKRVRNLDALFPPTKLKMTIQNNPNILTDEWNDVLAKVLYIHKEMGLEQPQIAASRCLRRSLLHIKTRHLFLFRAGLYKTPNLVKDKQSHRWNPSLMEIMDTSDKHFANRVARLTEKEYAVFKDMIAEEVKGSDYDFQDYDDSDEEDSKLSYNKHR